MQKNTTFYLSVSMVTTVNKACAMDNYLDLKFLAIGDSGVGKVSN